MPRITLPLLVLTAALALAGCESAEERAERHYLSALALLEAGDPERAAVEFRNVFKYDETHREARARFAELLIARGDIRGGYGQYLRLVEQYPDAVAARLTLAELAIANGDWAEAERHGRAAVTLEPAAPRPRALAAALDYRAALAAEDTAAADAAVAAARAVLEDAPQMQIARRVLIDALLNGRTPQLALPQVEAALEQEPASLEFHGIKLNLLATMRDEAGVTDQLRLMAELFPQEEDVQRNLVTWHVERGELSEAEAHLRSLAAAAPPGEAGPHVAVVQFLEMTAGPEAARAELDRLIAAAPETAPETGDAAAEDTEDTAGSGAASAADLYRTLRASLDFDAGRTDEAIAALEEVLAGAAPSDQTRGIKVSLARMRQASGDAEGARALLDEVLAEDPAQIDALRLTAARLITEDRPGEAIVALRRALDQDPRDAETLTLMAAAHERDGARELAGERLALAVEVSGSGAEESLRYARFVLQDGRTEVADTVLTEALRLAPGDLRLLGALAEVRIAAGDWTRAQEVIARLRAQEGEAARRLADEAQAALMLGQDRAEETIGFLQDLVAQGDADVSAVAVVLRTLVTEGKTEEARAYLDERLALAPQDPVLRLLGANLHDLAGDAAAAEEVLRALVAENPGAEAPVTALYGLLRRADRPADATAVLDAALAAGTPPLRLLWFKAGEHEAAGEFDAAIAIYEQAYARDGDNLVIANNLASLITTHRDDAQSLERAAAIARRLRGSQVPAFQDTYGWIEYRRGNLDEALAHLEPAAAGLPQDPLVRYHLGMTYAGLDRVEEARAALTEALALAGDSPLPQFAIARETLAALPLGQ